MNNDEAKDWLGSRVSRETMDRIEILHDLLVRWQKTINLVAPSTLGEVWSRHIVDSAQIFELSPAGQKTWLDFGSGGGFPGLVIAAMGAEHDRKRSMTLVESDVRKCGFMREAARRMDLKVQILNQRISKIPDQAADVISARALGSLDALLDHSKPHIKPGTCLLFPKGASYKDELEPISQDWQSIAEIIPSATDSDAVVLRFIVPTTE